MATYTNFYPNVNKATLLDFMQDMVKYLINDPTSVYLGPTAPWSIIQTYSSAAASPFEVPADPYAVSTLAADNSWRTGALVVGDYIVLQSGSALNPFQVLFEYDAAYNIKTITAPTGGFDTTANQADPENAANWLNPKLAIALHYTDAVGFVGGVANYSIIASDEGDDVLFWSENAVTYMIGFSGKLVNTIAADANPVVTFNNAGGNTTVYMAAAAGLTTTSWKRLSAVDGTTALSLGGCYLYSPSVGMIIDSAIGYSNDATGSGSYRILELWLSSSTAGHIGLQGTLPSIFMGDETLFGVGTQTINTKAYGYIKSGGTSGGVVFPWDGVTVL